MIVLYKSSGEKCLTFVSVYKSNHQTKINIIYCFRKDKIQIQVKQILLWDYIQIGNYHSIATRGYNWN